MKPGNKKTATCLVGILMVHLLFLHSGCKPKEDPTEARRAQVMSNLVQKTRSTNATRRIVRPIITSQAAPNQRQWALQALLRGYESSGHTNAVWDDEVRRAFEAFASYSRVSTTNWPALKESLADVVATKCDDPMIQYMLVRYSEERKTDDQIAADFARAHDAIEKSQHHPVFKFFAGMRALSASRAANKETPRGNRIGMVMADLIDLARDTNAPMEEVFQGPNMLFDHSTDKRLVESIMNNIRPLFEPRFGQTEQWFSLIGRSEIALAWGDRGHSYAYKVTDEGWKGFEEHLNKAEAALLKAWELNSTNAWIAYEMMRVELGQGRGKSRMNTWFNRAMALAPDYYDAASLMGYYLEPRWHGSEGEALAFARSCVTSKTWGGRVPLVLHHLHVSLSKYYQLSNSPAYWHRPHVWPDEKSAFEKYFANCPDDVSYRHDYAKAAYDCGQYRVFLEQAKLFSTGTNHTFFGGPENFQAMIQKAGKAASESPP
jgi:hypothetical protein